MIKDYIEKYSNIIREKADLYGYKICDLSHMKDYLVDGVHFGNNGYKEIAQSFFNVIKGYNKCSNNREH